MRRRALRGRRAPASAPAAQRAALTPGPTTWRARFAHHDALRGRTPAWAAAHALPPFPAPASLSPTVTCLTAPTLDIAALVSGLESRGHEISNGYGDLENKTFRIGHMGDHTLAGLEGLLRAADEVIASLPSPMKGRTEA